MNLLGHAVPENVRDQGVSAGGPELMNAKLLCPTPKSLISERKKLNGPVDRGDA
jgi:hypothetical protein